MVRPKSSKQKMDRYADDDDRRRDKRSKRGRSRSRTRSRSPAEARYKGSRRKRRYSKSRSPHIPSKQGKHNESQKEPEIKSEPPTRKAKETDMLNTRTGGAYIPPARLRMMQAEITDKSSVAYQRLAWEALKKSIHGHINKINVGNIGIIIKELLKENIVRGRGLLSRSVIQAQAASPTFTNVYAALVSAVNSRFPNIGELLLKRLVIQFKRGFKRNDKAICISSASFIAHLVNQRVAHEILALELLTLLVETPTDDSVEVAIAFLKECGQKLTEVSTKGVNAIFEMLRNILHEGQLDKRVQYMIEVMFQVWKDGFKDHPALLEELELVPEEEQFTHLLMLDDATDSQDILNVFKFDDKYEENEAKYKSLSKEILGSDAESGEEGSGESGSEESEDEDEEQQDGEQKGMTIIDNTETNLVALRRTIYLTINSSLDFEECAHKLMKMQLKPGQEVELCHMFLDCCAEQRTYEKFYGLLAQRFCNINRIYIGPFEEIFKDSYSTAHRLDTNRLRNVSKFFAHLLFTDSISWEVLECVKLNEEDTTSSSRIYIKILFQELAEYMGLKKLNDRLKDPTLQGAFGGVFPRDNPKNTRFSINFFTSIGLGGLTDELREHLKQMPKNVPPPAPINLGSSDSSSSSSSSSDSSSSDSSSSDSDEEESSKKKKDKKKTKKDPKEKSPKPTEDEPKKDTSKWGHDGFYDTYGKDARRTETRPERARAWDKFDIQGRSDASDKRNRDEDSRNRREENRGRNRENKEESSRYREDSGRHREESTRNREESARNDRRDKDNNYENRDEQPRNDRREREDQFRNDRRERERNRADDNNESSRGIGKEARNDRRDIERRSDKRDDRDKYDRKESNKDEKDKRENEKGDKERNKKNDRSDKERRENEKVQKERNKKNEDDKERKEIDKGHKEKNKKKDRSDRDEKDKRDNDKGDEERKKKIDRQVKDRYNDKSNDRRDKEPDTRTSRNDEDDEINHENDRYVVSERYYGGTNDTNKNQNKRDEGSESDSYNDGNVARNKKYYDRGEERKDKRRDQDRYANDSDEETDSRKNKRKDKENQRNDEYESEENDKPSRYWDFYGKKDTIEKGSQRTEGSKERRKER